MSNLCFYFVAFFVERIAPLEPQIVHRPMDPGEKAVYKFSTLRSWLPPRLSGSGGVETLGNVALSHSLVLLLIQLPLFFNVLYMAGPDAIHEASIMELGVLFEVPYKNTAPYLGHTLTILPGGYGHLIPVQ